MRALVVFIFLATILTLSASFTLAATKTLIGRMAIYNYLIGGTWACDVSIPARGDKPPTLLHNMANFEPAPGNVLHSHVFGPGGSGDDYYGYSSDLKRYWHGSLDSTGHFGYAESSDGSIFEGNSWSGDSSAKIRMITTYTKLNENKRFGRLIMSENGRRLVVAGLCNR